MIASTWLKRAFDEAGVRGALGGPKIGTSNLLRASPCPLQRTADLAVWQLNRKGPCAPSEQAGSRLFAPVAPGEPNDSCLRPWRFEQRLWGQCVWEGCVSVVEGPGGHWNIVLANP